jgi:predicted dehydrogenase
MATDSPELRWGVVGPGGIAHTCTEAVRVDARVSNGFQFQIADMARCVAEGSRERPG